jgi:flagellar motility protein MotE (MotC chaperone)
MSVHAVAQQSWAPTVATAPGGQLHGEPYAVFSGQAQSIDPRFFPAPGNGQALTPLRSTLPQGAWSPIVTGAIPTPLPAQPAVPAQPPSSRAPTTGFVPPIRAAQPGVQRIAATPEAATAIATGANQAGSGAPSDTLGSSSDTGLPKAPGPLEALPPTASAAQQYCFNTTDSAADARFAWQAKKIQEMEAELDRRSQQLEAKTQDYKLWLARRDEFSRKAQEKLVGFYAKMRPDAAAMQLVSMDEETAAAVLTKLDTKIASAIMGEMPPEDAAKIATIISGAAKIPPARKPPATAANAEGEGAGATLPAATGGAPTPGLPGAAAPAEQPKS